MTDAQEQAAERGAAMLRDEGVPESQISDAAELWLLVSSAKNDDSRRVI